MALRSALLVLALVVTVAALPGVSASDTGFCDTELRQDPDRPYAEAYCGLKGCWVDPLGRYVAGCRL